MTKCFNDTITCAFAINVQKILLANLHHDSRAYFGKVTEFLHSDSQVAAGCVLGPPISLCFRLGGIYNCSTGQTIQAQRALVPSRHDRIGISGYVRLLHSLKLHVSNRT